MRRALLVVTLISAGCWAGKSDRIGEIAAHKWWRKPPSRAQVEKLVQAIVKANEGMVVFFDADGRFKVIRDDGTIFIDGPPGAGITIIRSPDEIGEPYGYVRIEGYRRFTRDDAIDSIISTLDHSEFRDGPAKK